MVQQVRHDNLKDFAAQFWSYVNNARVFAFHGPMGAGKTTLITALCKYKGVKEAVASPTFSIINQYVFEENGEERMIYHMDLYRLKSLEEVVQAGVEDSIYSGEICMVEWPDKAPELFDGNTIHVYIEPITSTERRVRVEKALAQSNSII